MESEIFLFLAHSAMDNAFLIKFWIPRSNAIKSEIKSCSQTKIKPFWRKIISCSYFQSLPCPLSPIPNTS